MECQFAQCLRCKDEDKFVNGSSEDDQPEMSEVSEMAEVSRLIDIIISSLYSDQQVLLREDRTLRIGRSFHSVLDDSYFSHFKDLEIKVEHDPDAKTVSIIDSGIGMSKADLINNLGKLLRGHGRWILRPLPDATLRSLCFTGSLGPVTCNDDSL